MRKTHFGFIALLMVGTALAAPAPAPVPAASAAPVEQKPVVDESHKYTYSADRFVDPFVPSIGAGSAAAPQEFEPAGAEVGGMISTKRGKIAIIKVATGGTYVVRGGHVLDHAGHVIEKYLARIDPDSVVVWAVTGPERFVYPIRMRHRVVQ